MKVYRIGDYYSKEKKRYKVPRKLKKMWKNYILSSMWGSLSKEVVFSKKYGFAVIDERFSKRKYLRRKIGESE